MAQLREDFGRWTSRPSRDGKENPKPGGRPPRLVLWMDEILHQFETMGSHCLLVFTGESFIPRFLRWCRILSIHSRVEHGWEAVWRPNF